VVLLFGCGGEALRDESGISQMRMHAAGSPTKLARESHRVRQDMAYRDRERPDERFNTEEYDRIRENEFRLATENPLSTLSIDVDTAAYSNVRRFIRRNQLPPKDAVRIEEMINYFTYRYPQPGKDHPFSVTTEISSAPWNSENRLIHVGIQGRSLDYDDVRPANLVFLVDSSGSMSSSNKLPLLKKSLAIMLDKLSDRDRIAIVAYAGSAGLVLPSTSAGNKKKIIRALDRLQSGGSTAGGAGIELAYRVALKNFIKDGNNRVILCTDGDFNIGQTSTSELVRMIEKKRKQGVFLTIAGYGMGNYKDGRMEQISNAGNGNYFYIDSMQEAKKVFVTELRANMVTIAKDVKIQIEFNPKKVKGYRLIGYENRLLAKEDFDDDTKDAGELGAGHTVTALYEIIPAGSNRDVRSSGGLKYQSTDLTDQASTSDEIMTIKLRYKRPEEEKSRLIVKPVADSSLPLVKTSDNFRFSASVAGFGMLLRDSKFKNTLTYDQVIKLARGSRGKDAHGYRREFIDLVGNAKLLSQ
jgi:Ca-activated chloride channel family protein